MKTITLAEIQELRLNEVNFIFVNALSPEIFKKSHIPGSINLAIKNDDFDDMARHMLPDYYIKIVTYCTGPN